MVFPCFCSGPERQAPAWTYLSSRARAHVTHSQTLRPITPSSSHHPSRGELSQGLEGLEVEKEKKRLVAEQKAARKRETMLKSLLE